MWSDKESESDYLNFGEVSQLAVDILNAPGMLPVSVGIFGIWGAGKSSLLKLIEKDLAKSGVQWLTIRFDAWLYQGYDDSRAALLEIIARGLETAAKDNESLLKKAQTLLSRVDGFRALGLLGEVTALAFGVPTGGLIARGVNAVANLKSGIKGQEEYQELAEVAEDSKQETGSLIKPKAKTSPPQEIEAFRREYGEVLTGLGKPLVVIIDNLDRCLPANAIQTLEAIRLFLFLPNTAFIIAADDDMIRAAVAEHFKGASTQHQIDYIDKLIQVPMRVPKAGIREVRSYLFMLHAQERGVVGEQLEILRSGLEKSLQQSWRQEPISRHDALALIGQTEDGDLGKAFDLADRIAPILANSPSIQGNPRIVKRLINVIKMRLQIARRREISLDEAVITKLVIFERCAGADATKDLYHMIDAENGKPALLVRLEEDDRKVLPSGSPDSWGKEPALREFVMEWARLDPPLKEIDLRPAVYLSRETLPVGVYVVGLSAKGRVALEMLVNVKSLSSPSGGKAVSDIPSEEQVSVMEGIIDHLRQVTDWLRQPAGFAGACLLARRSPEAAKILKRFVLNMEGKRPPWMQTTLKEEAWFKE